MSGFSRQFDFGNAEKNNILSSIHVAALVRVISFDPASMTVNVQPIAQRLNDGGYTAGSQVLGVPVAGTRGGGFIFRPWYKQGDVGIVVYLDHDIDAPLKAGGEVRTNTERMHSDSDAVFLGGIVAGGWSSSGLPEGLVMAAEDGSVYLAVTSGGIQIKGTVTVDGDVNADGISLMNHTHSDVEPGGGNSGKPQ